MILALAVSACGKKGPPLAPIVHVPASVQQIATRRIGDDVFLTFILPTQNVDESVPVDLGRIEVYAYTGPASPPIARFTEVATLIGTLEGSEGTAPTVLRDTLTPEELVAGRPLAPVRSGPAPSVAAAPGGDPRGPLRRFYMAVTVSDRGRPGPPSAVVELVLTPPPDPPLEVHATYTAEAALLSWEPSGGLIGFVLERGGPPTASPLDDNPQSGDTGTASRPPTRYNVYKETVSEETTASVVGQVPAMAPPQALNQMPIDGFSFTDPLQVDGRRRCYAVTAVRGTGAQSVEGPPSSPVCFTPVDTFPPAPPTGVSPIAVEGAISLVWEANTEPDVRGYIVLRGEAGDATLRPVTDQAIAEPRFTDRDVRLGVRYVYAVTAVDARLPQPNVSAESERVEVTAR